MCDILPPGQRNQYSKYMTDEDTPTTTLNTQLNGGRMSPNASTLELEPHPSLTSTDSASPNNSAAALPGSTGKKMSAPGSLQPYVCQILHTLITSICSLTLHTLITSICSLTLHTLITFIYSLPLDCSKQQQVAKQLCAVSTTPLC